MIKCVKNHNKKQFVIFLYKSTFIKQFKYFWNLKKNKSWKTHNF